MLFPLMLVALLAVLTYWLQRAANPEDPVHKAENRHDPDYIIDNVNARSFDANGALKQSMLATRLTHFPDDDSTLVIQPQINYRSGEQTTEVRAEEANVTRDNKQVFLRGNVHMVRPPLADTPATVLQTDALTAYPDDDIVEGSVPVTIKRGMSVISGDRIHYNGKTSTAIMSGRVKGTFYQAKKS